MEAVSESSRIMPISSSNVTSIVCWYTSNIDDDTEDDKTTYRTDFDHGQNEFNFTEPSDAKKLNCNKDDEENCDPDCRVDVISPEFNSDRGSCQLEGQNCQPTNGIFLSIMDQSSIQIP